MPIITQGASSTVTFDPRLCENARMLLIGVKRYDHFAGQDVASAHNNIIAWMIQLMRMGMSPHGNAVHLDTTTEELTKIVDGVLFEADLDAEVRKQITTITDAWLGKKGATTRWDDAPTVVPTFARVLISLVDLANHLHWIAGQHASNPAVPLRRLLVVFSGHGALSAGRLVLCTSDATKATSPSAADLLKRKQALLAPFSAKASVLQELFVAAEQRGALPELLDVLERAAVLEHAAPNGGSWLYLDLPTILRNLRQLPKVQAAPEADYVKVITPVHLQLVFGALGQRVTLVLDACHSGGDGQALQGTQSVTDWTRLGLPCRILSASQKAQLAAEATLGERSFSAATWALTHVLSRWQAVQDTDAYAYSVTHGNLLLRANMLLEALSFNQQLSLSAPPDARQRVSDLPFFGQYASTKTTVDPNADANGIQLDSDSPRVWEITKGGALKAVLFVTTPTAPGVHQLYVLGDDGSADSLQGSACSMRMIAAHADNVSAELSWYNSNAGVNFRQLACTPAAPGSEPAYPTNPTPPATPAYVSAQYGSNRKVWMRWLPSTSTNKGALVFVLDSQTPYNQGCFDPNNAMSFNTASSVPFGAGWYMATIELH